MATEPMEPVTTGAGPWGTIRFAKGENQRSSRKLTMATVDGQNPAPPGKVKTL